MLFFNLCIVQNVFPARVSFSIWNLSVHSSGQSNDVSTLKRAMPVSITFPVVILSEIDDRSHIYQIIWAYEFPDRLFQRLLVNAIDN